MKLNTLYRAVIYRFDCIFFMLNNSLKLTPGRLKLTDHSVRLVPNCRFLSSRGLEIRGPSQIKPSGSGDENDHFQPILPTGSPMLLIIINMMFKKRIIFLPRNSYGLVYIVVYS